MINRLEEDSCLTRGIWSNRMLEGSCLTKGMGDITRGSGEGESSKGGIGVMVWDTITILISINF